MSAGQHVEHYEMAGYGTVLPRDSDQPACGSLDDDRYTTHGSEGVDSNFYPVRANIFSAAPISLLAFRADTMRAISISRPVSPAAPPVTLRAGGHTPSSRTAPR